MMNEKKAKALKERLRDLWRDTPKSVKDPIFIAYGALCGLSTIYTGQPARVYDVIEQGLTFDYDKSKVKPAQMQDALDTRGEKLRT